MLEVFLATAQHERFNIAQDCKTVKLPKSVLPLTYGMDSQLITYDYRKHKKQDQMEIFQFLLMQWAAQVGQISLPSPKPFRFKAVMDGDTLWTSLLSICAY